MPSSIGGWSPPGLRTPGYAPNQPGSWEDRAPEVRERAVRMVLEHEREYPSEWAVMESIRSSTADPGNGGPKGSCTRSRSRVAGDDGSSQSANRLGSMIAGCQWWMSASLEQAAVVMTVKDSRAAVVRCALGALGQRRRVHVGAWYRPTGGSSGNGPGTGTANISSSWRLRTDRPISRNGVSGKTRGGSEFDHPGRFGSLGHLGLAPAGRDGANEPVSSHPARQGAHVAVFERPLGPQGRFRPSVRGRCPQGRRWNRPQPRGRCGTRLRARRRFLDGS